MVTNQAEYYQMVQSFTKNGFSFENTEYLLVDNSRLNQLDAYEALNAFLQTASADFIIVCHQDVLLLDDDQECLQRAIADVEARDPNWAVLGNATPMATGDLAAPFQQKSVASMKIL
jgi:hypothetical protein